MRLPSRRRWATRCQQVVTENEAVAKNAINHLKYAKAGRATFLPLDVIQPQRLSADGIERMEGFVARADELVSCDERYRGIVANLLGRIAVAQDIDAAVEIARKFRYRFRIVTLDGQLVNAGGSMTRRLGLQDDRPALPQGGNPHAGAAD